MHSCPYSKTLIQPSPSPHSCPPQPLIPPLSRNHPHHHVRGRAERQLAPIAPSPSCRALPLKLLVLSCHSGLIESTIMAAKKAEQAWFEMRKASSANKAAKKAELHSKHVSRQGALWLASIRACFHKAQTVPPPCPPLLWERVHAGEPSCLMANALTRPRFLLIFLLSTQMEAMAIASALGPFVHAIDEEAAHMVADLISDDVHDKYAQKVRVQCVVFVFVLGKQASNLSGHPPNLALLISDSLSLSGPALAPQIVQALRPLYPAMGITADMIGTYGATDNACRKLARKL